MNYTITEITDPALKNRYTDGILRKLPDWFGIEEALVEYTEAVQNRPFWAAFDGDTCIGFFSGEIHYQRTGEIYVCGVDSQYHHQGIGTALYETLETYFLRKHCEYVIVKTLSELREDTSYAKTRQFYRKLGFAELVTLKELWGKENPCLIMIKKL
jgi:ribosomal protein S18 acetylase RimI-like enzyme